MNVNILDGFEELQKSSEVTLLSNPNVKQCYAIITNCNDYAFFDGTPYQSEKQPAALHKFTIWVAKHKTCTKCIG